MSIAKKSTENTFTQKNGMTIEVGHIYRTVVGELVRVDVIDLDRMEVKVFNISISGNSFHRIDSAIKDNKFIEFIR